MFENLQPFLLHWAITAMALWVASHVLQGIKFAGTGSLLVSAVLLGFANAVVKPVLVVLTLPLTFITFGLFLLVINALMVLLVARLVTGFKVTGFWSALWASVFVSVLSFALGAWLPSDDPAQNIQMPKSGLWL